MFNFDRFIEVTGKITAAQCEVDEARRLEHGAQPCCGNCQKWMKNTCPAEKSDMSGYSKGPSCNGPKCSQFVETADAGNRRAKAKACREKALEILGGKVA